MTKSIKRLNPWAHQFMSSVNIRWNTFKSITWW